MATQLTHLDIELSCASKEGKARSHDTTQCNSTANCQSIDDVSSVPDVVAQFK